MIDYDERLQYSIFSFLIVEQPVFGVRKMNRVAVEDLDKVLLSKFDESIPEQHQMKCLVGCGVYFGFRGIEEHAQLRVEQIEQGVFEPGHKYAGKIYAGIGHLKTDKKRKLTVNTSYLRDTKNIMRIPIVDDNDDPSSDCFASSLLRMLKKTGKGQKRFYCYHTKNKGYQARKPKGKNVISKMHLEAAKLLGISTDSFSGGHAWRSVMITKLANDPRVSVTETMLASRHTSVSANAAYQASDRVSEGNKLDSLLDFNPAAKKKARHLTFQLSQDSHNSSNGSDLDMDSDQLSVSVGGQSVGGQPMNTQEEFHELNKEYDEATIFFRNAHVSPPNFAVRNPYKVAVRNPYKVASKKPLNYPKNDQTPSNNQEEFNELPVVSTIKKESSYQDKTNDLSAHSSSMYQRPANSRQAVAMAKDLVSSANNQRLIGRKHHQGPAELSAAHLEIRKLRIQLNAMKQDHRLDVQDYQERISDMEGNFQYDHNNGNWYSDRKKRHSY